MSDEIRKAGYGAKAGETIAGNLARGGDGKFTNAGNASAAKPKPKAKAKGSARAAAAKARAEEAARKKAEREQARQAKLVERKQAAMERELARKKKAEEKAKKGGGGGKKDDKEKEAKKEAEKAAKEAKKAAEKKAAERQKALAARRAKREQARAQAQAAQQRAQQQQQRQQAQASRQQQARSDRQAAANQRRADAQQRQAAQAQRQQQARAERQQRQAEAKAEREKRQAETAKRQQQAAAERKARQAEAEKRRAAAEARREAAAKGRAERQRLMDARRAKLDAAREKMQGQLAERRAAAEARARAKFSAWQQQQQSKPAADEEPAVTPPTTTTKLAKALNEKAVLLSASITKIDAEQRIVEGIASDETPDVQAGMYKGQYVAGDVVDADAIAAALPAYLEWGNIREMHQPSAVGVAVMAEMRERKLHLAARIVDDAAWKKVVEGVYKGFSIGGSSESSEIIKIGDVPFRKITKLQLTEISLVDRPANPAARFTLWKGHDMPPVENEPAEESAGIAKAAGDPTKAITMLQALRDEAELAGNLDAAQGFSLSIAAALEAAGIAQPADDMAEDEEPIEEEPIEDDPLAEGAGLDEADPLAMLDDMPDEEAALAMAARISTLAKAGRTFSTATMGHLQSMHDTLVKMTGGGLCKADPLAQSAQATDVQKAAAPDLAAQLAALTERLAQLEAQPAEGKAPQLRAIEKSLTGQEDEKPTRVIKAHRLEDLRRLAMTEPDPSLRADYKRQLAEAEKA